jgi:hypothetical protein
MHATVASNTAVTLSRQYQGNTAEKVAANLFDSLGAAHLTLLSLEVMGLALLAGTLPVRRALAVALVGDRTGRA